MLDITTQHQFKKLTYCHDHDDPNLVYVLPPAPRLRLDDKGCPAFTLILYRGAKDGGFALFDTELVVDDQSLSELTAHLNGQGQATVRFGAITYTSGKAQLLLKADQGIVQQIDSAGEPNLYGSNVCAFLVKLSPQGAGLLASSMSAPEGAGLLQVAYDLRFWTALPEVTATVRLNGKRVREYIAATVTQDTRTGLFGWMHGSQTLTTVTVDKLREQGCGSVEVTIPFHLADPDADKALHDRLTEWATKGFEDLLKNQLAAAEKEKPDAPWERVQDKERTWTEHPVIEWPFAPQGNLGTIAALVGPDRLEDYIHQDRDGVTYFEKLMVQVRVNLEFTRLGIAEVVVHMAYPNKKQDLVFTKTDTTYTFETYYVDNKRDYTYSYRVIYKSGEVVPFEAKNTDETELIVSTDDTGCLVVDVNARQLAFAEASASSGLSEVRVALQYPAEGAAHAGYAPEYEDTVSLDSANREAVFRYIRKKPITGEYRFRVTYLTVSGAQWTTAWAARKPKELLRFWLPPKRPDTLKVIPSRDLSGLDAIYLSLRYVGVDDEIVDTKELTIEPGKSPAPQDWPVDLTISQGRFEWRATYCFSNGDDRATAWARVAGPDLVIRKP